MTQAEMFGKAKWLCHGNRDNVQIFVLRGRFDVNKVKKATLRVIGLGFFHCYINGERVGDDHFLPLNSDYEARENFPE